MGTAEEFMFLDKGGIIRHRTTLEDLGKWFRIGVHKEIYIWLPNKKLKQLLKQ